VGQAIAANLPADNSLRLTQKYLAASVTAHVAFKGGGISAMPSMHLGAASIYIFAAQRTKWLVPAVLFWLTIFVLSGYFGYHYWVDGLGATVIAWLCWCASEFLFAGSVTKDQHGSNNPRATSRNLEEERAFTRR
jgi:membrane-associated phospholipid phosphatase